MTQRWPGAAAAPFTALACAGLLALLLHAAAQADPMRPLLAPALPATPASGVATALVTPTQTPATGAPGGAAAAVSTARVLLAIRSNSQGERLALFGDRWLRVGDRFSAVEGDTTVLAIGPNQVDLKQDKLRQTHYLLPPLLPGQWPEQAARSGTLPHPKQRAARAEQPGSP